METGELHSFKIKITVSFSTQAWYIFFLFRLTKLCLGCPSRFHFDVNCKLWICEKKRIWFCDQTHILYAEQIWNFPIRVLSRPSDPASAIYGKCGKCITVRIYFLYIYTKSIWFSKNIFPSIADELNNIQNPKFKFPAFPCSLHSTNRSNEFTKHLSTKWCFS